MFSVKYQIRITGVYNDVRWLNFPENEWYKALTTYNKMVKNPEPSTNQIALFKTMHHTNGAIERRLQYGWCAA